MYCCTAHVRELPAPASHKNESGAWRHVLHRIDAAHEMPFCTSPGIFLEEQHAYADFPGSFSSLDTSSIRFSVPCFSRKNVASGAWTFSPTLASSPANGVPARNNSSTPCEHIDSHRSESFPSFRRGPGIVVLPAPDTPRTGIATVRSALPRASGSCRSRPAPACGRSAGR